MKIFEWMFFSLVEVPIGVFTILHGMFIAVRAGAWIGISLESLEAYHFLGLWGD